MTEILPGLDLDAQLLDIDRVDCEESLYTFLKSAWKYIDPAPWKDAWHIDAIAEHLQAVVDGQIRRLIINLPPRHCKSLLLSVAFPAWVWAQPITSPTSGPGVPFLYASYADKLSLRDSVKCRRLIESTFYQSRWGNRFQLLGDSNTKSRFGTDRGGERLITSIGAGVTGEGGNIICFPADEAVATERGHIEIGEIVRKRMKIRVWSFNHETQRSELKPIVGWFTNPASDIVRIGLSDGTSFRCTPDHHIWTRRGYVKARDLTSLDVLPGFSVSNRPDRLDCCFIFRRKKFQGELARANQAHGIFGKFCVHVGFASQIIVAFLSRIIWFDPRSGLSYFSDRFMANAVLSPKRIGVKIACQNLVHHFLAKSRLWHSLSAQSGPMPDHIPGIFLWGSVVEIFERIVEFIPVPVTHVNSNLLRSYKGPANNSMNMDDKRPHIFSKTKTQVAVIPNMPFEDFWSIRKDHAFNSSVSGNFIPVESRYRTPLNVSFCGHESETFCLEVADNHNFHAGYGNTLVSNCIDDPNAANEVASEATMQTTLDWWRTTIPTRANDPETCAWIIIQQRLAEDDLTGHILEHEADGWTHLCLPGRYEPERSFVTTIGWKDPRTEPGELLWPERFSEESLKRLEVTMGPYIFCGQIQQRPEPKGGGIIKREWWKLWEADSYPPMDFVLATLDGAFTTDRINDPSGMIIWGIFSGDVKAQTTRIVGPSGEMIRPDSTYSEFAPRVMCMYAWDKHLELHELVEKVAQTCIRMKVDLLVIENKASGISVAQEIRRLYSRERFGVELFDPKSQDKAARLYSVQHLFAEGIIYGPDRPWMERVITQVGQFPKGKHDEYVDLTSMGLRKLRDMGLLVRQPEREAEIEASKVYPGRQGDPLYPV